MIGAVIAAVPPPAWIQRVVPPPIVASRVRPGIRLELVRTMRGPNFGPRIFSR
jgi:hypothetical protein